MSEPAANPLPDRNAAWLAVAAAVLAALALSFYQAFMTPPEMLHPGSGTAWAPHSDALGPWMDGGLAYLFGLQMPTYIYRPTVALWWGSLLAATSRIEAIPMFFLAWMFATLAAAFAFMRDQPVRNAIIVGLGICALRFGETWASVNLNVDLVALIITLSGMVLILWGRGDAARAALLAGALCIGVAAAIRGPMMLAGILIIGVRVLVIERTSWRLIAAAAALFVAPLGIDIALQRHWGTINNGMMALFCVYSDPTHGWTGACNIEFLKQKPKGLEIARGFLLFLVSDEGRTRLFNLVSWRAGRDLASLHATASLAFLLAAGWLANRGRGEPKPEDAAIASPLLRALLVVASLGAVRLVAPHLSWAPLAWTVLMLAAACFFRQWRAVLCLLGYLSGTVWLCMAGLLEDRLQYTFAFCLFFGAAFLVIAPPHLDAEAPDRPSAARSTVAIAIVAAFVYLYMGSFIVRSQMRETYLREVHGRTDFAMKVADDASIDRSLYYTGQRQFIYTRHDTRPIGAVRKYSRLANASSANLSFVAPNAFVD